MHIAYTLLSPTFGMHQYTADPANHAVAAGHDVHLVTSRHYPADRYHPAITVHTPVDTTNTGLSAETLRLDQLRRARRAIIDLAPDIVHFTGPHLWNVPLLWSLRRAGIPTVHTIHDLDPHTGTSRLLYLWNRAVIRLAGHVLVHGQCYRRQLLDAGLPPDQVTHTPLLHLFLDHAHTAALTGHSAPASKVDTRWFRYGPEAPRSERRLSAATEGSGVSKPSERRMPSGPTQPTLADAHLSGRSAAASWAPVYERWALFFGRLEPYKGIPDLLHAAALLDGASPGAGLVLAGPGPLEALWPDPLPANVERRDHLVGDEEALELFSRCGLLVLPYTAATQSALVAAAYFFRKPVIVTRSGALPEYVVEGETGWVVPPGDPQALAGALAQALSDPARLAEMGAAGRAWYEEQREGEREALRGMYEGVRG